MPVDDLVDRFRIVLDESSFNFRGHDDSEVYNALAALNDLLMELAMGGHTVARWSDVYEVECRDSFALYDFLFDSERHTIGRDEKLRLSIALSKLPCWDEAEPVGVPLEPLIDGRDAARLAPSVGYALLAAIQEFAVACAVFPLTPPQGYCQVSDSCGTEDLFFFSANSQLPIFWRSTLRIEQVTEREYFERAHDAFPSLLFHKDLTFSKFDGNYIHLREPVSEILSLLNDHFVRVWRNCKGQPHDVAAEMSALGVAMSRESVKTRASDRYIAMRDIEFEGATHRCEWHAKLEPHRNRIHFALPCPELDDRVLVGMFVEHLPLP